MSHLPTLTRSSEPDLASPERQDQHGAADAKAGHANIGERLDGVSAHGLSSTRGLSPMTADNEVEPLDFDAVVAEHGPYIWRVLRRLGVRPSDVEDVWQETFIVVHRKLDAFEGRSQLRTWLSAIAVRVASDYRNRAHRRREQATDEVPDGGTAASQHEDLVEQERRALLDRLIGELKPEQREVIVLYEFAELPMQEVAEALGCPLQTAYSRLHAGRRALEQAARRESARRGLP
ncbi:MAG: polymerase sigma factor RpoE [Myxococcaceae bacterium]|nr:polymerase sigma factor RpoE [Myxococcaceae bacterium]